MGSRGHSSPGRRIYSPALRSNGYREPQHIESGVEITNENSAPGEATDIAGTTMRLNRSVLRAASLMSAIEEYRDGATPAMLATDTGLPRPTVFRLLLTLEHAGLVVRDAGRFASRTHRPAGENVRKTPGQVQVILDRLAADVRETVTYSTVSSPSGLDVIAEAPGPHILSSAAGYVGQDFPLHASAVGKLLLASQTDAEVAARLPEQLESVTPSTIRHRPALLEELARVRVAGYAVTDNELEDGLYALAVPVCGERDDLVGALAISGFDQRLRSVGVPALLGLLRPAAAELAQSLPATV